MLHDFDGAALGCGGDGLGDFLFGPVFNACGVAS
jgi:hypothetical protein